MIIIEEFRLDQLPEEILIEIIKNYYNNLKRDNDKNIRERFYNLIFINKSIANLLLNNSEFWFILISLYYDNNLLFHTYSKLDTNIYNSAYYCSSQSRIRSYLTDEIFKNGGNRHIVEILNKYLSQRTSVCSIPFESSFIIGGMGTNKYPFLRAYDYKGEEQVNYLQYNRVPEYRGKAIDSITCRNKTLIYSVLDSDVISIIKTHDLNEDKSGYLVNSTFKSNCLSSNQRNKVLLNPVVKNQFAIGSSDGSCFIYDFEKLITTSADDDDIGDDMIQLPYVWGHQFSQTLSIWDICFSNDGNLLFEVGESLNNGNTSYKNTGFVRCCDIRSDKRSTVWQLKELIEIGGISQSQDSNCIAYVGRSGLTRVIDLRNPSKSLTLFKPQCSFNYDYSASKPFFKDSVSWLPGGSNYLVSSSYNDIHIWSVNQGNSLTSLSIARKHYDNQFHHNQLAITDDGLLLCSYDTIYSLNDISDISIRDYLENQ